MAGRVDVSWLVGGPQGSGVESAAGIFSGACASMGYHVFGKREFYSNIKGEHSYFVVRASSGEVRSNVSGADIMVAYDTETMLRHHADVRGGTIIYDSGMQKAMISDVATMDRDYAARLGAELAGAGRPEGVEGAVDAARGAGTSVHAVSFRAILSSLAEEAGNPRLRGMTRMFNVIGASLSMAALGIPEEATRAAIRRAFAAKPEVARLNEMAASRAYSAARSEVGRARATLAPRGGPREGTMLAQGYHGTAIGKIAAGCRFQSYYPITPASDESVYLESHVELGVAGSRPGSTLVVQCEDEISAIGMAIGSSIAGARSSTCTSGPGFSLMAECLGWAGINEVPLVITLYQRSGPATGLPTRHGQDDLLFAVHAGHGEFPRIVYASGDVEESFYDTARCFNYADVYQVPVIHMMDKYLASTILTCRRFEASRVSIDRGRLLTRRAGEGYRRFALGGDGISERARLGVEGAEFWCTGDEHDEAGHITEDPVVRAEMMRKRLSREGLALRAIPDAEQATLYGSGEIAIVSWGSTKGPILDALEEVRAGGGPEMRFVQVKMLHPFPASYVAHLLEGATTIVDVESNYTGQLGALFARSMGREPDHYILKYTGRAMTSTELAGALRRVAGGTAGRREVLTYGA